ncbi:unnamed protein product [Moneuplotes crassus]|uniref:Uncharacterized protein n=1 Tax=Euplotes crassus TaxID=5936 RepID=A0AAD1UQD0_EUPCR|nr:unnamed protein product [Moneuplotes crassus]
MDTLPEFSFEYNQVFPQWDFASNYNELDKFSEKYGTVEQEFDDNSQKKMFNLQELEDVRLQKFNKSSVKNIDCLRKNPRRKIQDFLGESSLKLRHTLDPSLFCSEKGKYSERKDIVLKAVMRAIRRFYMNIFRVRYPSLLLLRIINVSQAELTRAVEDMCLSLFPADTVQKYKLNIFMQTLLDLKPPSQNEEFKEVFKSASSILKCCKSFSSTLFDKVCSDPCLQKICQKIQTNFEDEFLATLKNKEQNLDRYKKVLYSLC